MYALDQAAVGVVLAGQNALALRRIREQRDAESAGGVEYAVGFDFAMQQIDLNLVAGQRYSELGEFVVCGFHLPCREVTDADCTDLSGLHQPSHGTHLGAHRREAAAVEVDLVQVDGKRVQRVEPLADGALDTAGGAAQWQPLRRHGHIPRLDPRMSQAAGQRAFRRAAAVHLGGVEPCDAAVERRLDDRVDVLLRNRRRQRRNPALARELGGTKPDWGDVDVGSSKLSSSHETTIHHDETSMSRNETLRSDYACHRWDSANTPGDPRRRRSGAGPTLRRGDGRHR